jgi:hypothetical protein
VIPKAIITTLEAATQDEAVVGTEANTDLSIACSMRETDHRIRAYPIFLESKKKMTQKDNQPSNTTLAKKVNHTSH